jgi:TonB family protein
VIPETEVPALLKDFCARVKENMSPAISLSESPAVAQQFLARIEEEAISAQRRELMDHMTQAARFNALLDKCVSAKQRHHLLQVLGNPHTPESEWLRACEILGDYQYSPAPRTAPLRILLFAVCVSASVVIYTLSTHMLGTPQYVPVVAQPPVVVYPPVIAPSPIPVKADVSFGPYMADLQRRIKRAWFPPRGIESHRVVVVFKVHEHGELSNLRVTQSSGVATHDQAALAAVENASPFRPLPRGASEPVDIQFTFDYNITGAGTHDTFSPAK